MIVEYIIHNDIPNYIKLALNSLKMIQNGTVSRPIKRGGGGGGGGWSAFNYGKQTCWWYQCPYCPASTGVPYSGDVFPGAVTTTARCTATPSVTSVRSTTRQKAARSWRRAIPWSPRRNCPRFEAATRLSARRVAALGADTTTVITRRRRPRGDHAARSPVTSSPNHHPSILSQCLRVMNFCWLADDCTVRNVALTCFHRLRHCK